VIAVVQSAGVRHVAKSLPTNDVRNIPVNSDAYLQKGEDKIPVDEKVFFKYAFGSYPVFLNPLFDSYPVFL
jgi:hypothetical protein